VSAKSVTISNNDWKKINDILSRDSFKDVENITIENSGSIGGLGSILTLSFDYDIDGIEGRFITEISNEENW
jgi:hypothetical protein